MRNTPRQLRLLDRLWGLVGFGRGYSEEDVAQASIVSHPAPWHHENGRVVRDGPDVAALASEVRDLMQTAGALSQDLAELSQEMSALKRRRTRHLDLPPLGGEGHGGPVLTKTLLVSAWTPRRLPFGLAGRPFPFPAAAPSPVPGSDLDLFPSEAPES